MNDIDNSRVYAIEDCCNCNPLFWLIGKLMRFVKDEE